MFLEFLAGILKNKKMKTCIYIITFSLFHLASQSQPDTLIIKGKTYLSKEQSKKTNEVIATGNDGSKKKVLLEPNGNYQIVFHNPKFSIINVKLNDRDYYFKSSFIISYCYDESFLLDSNKSYQIINKDFCPDTLEAIIFPAFYFSKNSLKPNKALTTDFEKSIDTLVSIMKRNPTIIIELKSVSYSEGINAKDCDILETKRSQLIKDELIKKGIQKERVLTKSFCNNEKLKITQNDIEVSKLSKNEQELYRSLKRRCFTRIISWEFDDGTSKKPETPTYKPSTQKEGEMDNLLPVKPD